MEGGAAVLTRGVTQNPLLLSLASTVIQLAAGGALGGLPPSARYAAVTRSGWASGPAIDYERLALATAKALRQSPPRALISDVKARLARDSFTQSQANS